MSTVNELDNQILKNFEDIILRLDKEEENIKVFSEQRIKSISANRRLIGECIIKYKENLQNGILGNRAIEPAFDESLYMDYPFEGGIAEKFHFLEDSELLLWKWTEMLDLIKRVEGPLKAERTLDGIELLKKNLVLNQELVKIQFNDTKQFTFYTTRREWLDVSENEGLQIFAIKSEYMPDPSKIRTLTEAEKRKFTVQGY